MAVKLDDSGDGLDEVHEINVTPFIDVILVLLIIFMVAAPLSTVDIAVDLPAASAKPAQRPEKPLYLTIKADLGLAIGDETVARPALGPALLRAAEGDPLKRIFLRADKTVPYGAVMEVMNTLREAGFLKIALVTLEKTP